MFEPWCSIFMFLSFDGALDLAACDLLAGWSSRQSPVQIPFSSRRVPAHQVVLQGNAPQHPPLAKVAWLCFLPSMALSVLPHSGLVDILRSGRLHPRWNLEAVADCVMLFDKSRVLCVTGRPRPSPFPSSSPASSSHQDVHVLSASVSSCLPSFALWTASGVLYWVSRELFFL